jgi:cell division protein FtsI/penicillin-binding protein 2
MRRDRRLRLTLLLGVAALLWLALLGRGAYVTLVRHDELRQQVERQQTQIRTIPAQRGVILDCTGRTLACTLENPSVVLRLTEQSDRQALARALEQAGLCSREKADEIRRHQRPGFMYVNREWVDESRLAEVQTRFPEVCGEPEMKRYYPEGAVAPDVVGVVGDEGKGLSGLEWRCDRLLAGEPGQVLEFVTGGGMVENAPPSRELVAPHPGGGLLLALNAHMQQVVRHHLHAGMVASGAQWGFAILLDPRTGEILALHEEPDFDPLAPGNPPAELLKTACVTDQFEPGSTFKIVAFAAALDGGSISPSDTIYCNNGLRVLGSAKIRDHHPYGYLSAAGVLSHSSNIGTGRIAERVGWEGFNRMAQDLGFGQASGIDLGGEAAGMLPHPLDEHWSERSLITAAYGQEVACTGVQLAMAFAAIANDGVLMRPLLVKAELDAGGRIAQRCRPQAVRRAMSPETAHTLRELLRGVVTEGTGRAAEIPWFPPAGKTGTAQVIDSRTGAYAPGEHVLSFAGFAPHDDPRVTCVVALRCHGDDTASDIAAPIFAQIIKDLAWLLEQDQWGPALEADEDSLLVQVPDVRGLAPQCARSAMHRAGLVPVLVGTGGRVEAVSPPPYQAVPAGQIVHLALGSTLSHDTVQVPEVRGLSLRRAVGLLNEAGLRAGVSGSGWVVAQAPEAGAVVARGALITAQASADTSQARKEALHQDAFICHAW